MSEVITKLWKHQQGAIEYAREKPAVLLHMCMGSGKTLTTLQLIQEKAHRSVLILCPKAVIRVWAMEIEKHTEGFAVFPMDKTQGRDKMLDAALGIVFRKEGTDPAIIITNYEILRTKKCASMLQKPMWDLIVFDESHRIKAPTGSTSKQAAKLKATQKLALSGTPLPHSPLDIFGQYRALDDTIFGKWWTRFKGQYAVMGGPEGRWVTGTTNHDLLAQNMNKIRYEVTNSALDLPDLSFVNRSFQLDREEIKHYSEIENLYLTEWQGNPVVAANALVKMLRLQQLCGGYLVVELEDNDTTVNGSSTVRVGTSKQDALEGLLEDVGDEPIVVFARFTHELKSIHDVAERLGRKYGEVSGRVKQLDDWDAGKIDVLGVQHQAGCEGISLTDSRYLVWYSLPWSRGTYDQANARIHRPGQEKHCFIYHLLAEHTVDMKMAKALVNREAVINSVLNSYGVPIFGG